MPEPSGNRGHSRSAEAKPAGVSPAEGQADELDAELSVLVDHAVALGIAWPQIAERLRVTRQAARQQYQRRHREDVRRQGDHDNALPDAQPEISSLR